MITDAFDNKTEPMITMEAFGPRQEKVVDKCIIIFSHIIYDYMLEKFKCEQIAHIGGCDGGMPIYKFNNDGEDIAFYKSMIGSAGAAQLTIEANWLTGAEKFIMFGSCGNLNKELTEGKFIIPTEAYRDEGMSYHYAPPADYIKVKNADKMAEIFEELNIPYVKGKTWTTDAMLRETKGNAMKRRDEGCIAVEMEVAGVQAVCDYYGHELYDFLAAGDVFYENTHDIKGLSDANHNTDKLFIALELAKRI